MYVTHVRVSCEVNYCERAGKVADIMAVGRSYFVRTSLDHRSKHVSMVPVACIFSTASVCANCLTHFGKDTEGYRSSKPTEIWNICNSVTHILFDP